MADLSEKASAFITKIVGANPSTGVEDNCAEVDSSGNLQVKDPSNADGTQTTQIITSATGAQVLSAAPGSDTGQRALAVRVISQLGAGTGGTGSSAATVDRAGYAYASSSDTIIGGVYQDTSPGMNPGDSGAIRSTANRALHTNLRDSSGNELGVSGAPVVTSTAMQSDVTGSGSLGTNAATAFVGSSGTGLSSISWQIQGTWTGTTYFERTLDGVQWDPMRMVNEGTGDAVTTTTANGTYTGSMGSAYSVRLRRDISGSGTMTWNKAVSFGVKAVSLGSPIPTGTNSIGTVEPGNTANTTPWLMKPHDGTNAATIKAASTASVTTDTALVVALHPSSPTPAGTNTIGSVKITDGTNVPAVKAASTAAAATDPSLVVALHPTSPLPAGTSKVGTVDIATAPATAKGTQGANALPTQHLRDSGRNLVHYYTVIPVLTTATDTLQSLTGTKSGATVTATTTPAVVTTGKTFRVTRFAATYIATATSGYGIVRLRFNTGGVVAITSPVAATIAVGSSTPGTANAVGVIEASLDEGLEFAAATGVGISVQGFAAVTATAVGYVMTSITGYEY